MRTTTRRRPGSLPSSSAVHAVLALMACVACAPAPPPQGEQASAAEAEAAFRRFEDAWEREDIEAAAGTFVSDAVVFDPVPPGRFEGTEGIRAWISGSFDALEQISISTSEVRVQTAGRVAWVTGRYVLEAQQGEKPVHFEGDVTMVWVRQTDGSHKLSVFHASHLPSETGG